MEVVVKKHAVGKKGGTSTISGRRRDATKQTPSVNFPASSDASPVRCALTTHHAPDLETS